jgi:hypothetical protein
MARLLVQMIIGALMTLPPMAAVQEICDRTTLATGSGLLELAIRSAFSIRASTVRGWRRPQCGLFAGVPGGQLCLACEEER